MPITVGISVIKDKVARATVDGGRWSTNNSILRTMLLGIDEDRLIGKGIYYTPWLDRSLAELAISELGGEIIEIEDEPEFVDGRVY